VQTLIMGDVTYGACCIDDFTAKALGCDFLVHYGHSCLGTDCTALSRTNRLLTVACLTDPFRVLWRCARVSVPIDSTSITTLYVFVDIAIDVEHLIRTVKHNFKADTRMVLAGTIQFATAMQIARNALTGHFKDLLIPQAKPLSPGEVLGCTSPKFAESYDSLVFVADGRFHLESIMIRNPHIRQFHRYDPYSKQLTVERYGHADMHAIRQAAIARAKSATRWGVILGTLGRQGNTRVHERLCKLIAARGMQHVTVLLSEIFPAKLALFKDIDAYDAPVRPDGPPPRVVG
jgi:2-(3-amino-3-carboxypropyl)histidine synthase